MKLGYDPKSHYDKYKDFRERRAQERAAEYKFKSGVGRDAAFRSQLQYDLQHAQNRKARRTVTLAHVAFLDKPDPDSL